MEEEPVFVVREIDLDYEFDAARWFDLSRDESEAEARQAELWFETAMGYSQSPCIPRLLLRAPNAISSYTNSDDGGRAIQCLADANGSCDQYTFTSSGEKGFTSSGYTSCSKKSKSKTSATTIRSSTLMKPTASQLAKQNHSRLHVSMAQTKEKIFCTGYERQPPKRQKLEGGQSQKVISTKRPSNLYHKTSKQGGAFDNRNFIHPMMKLAVARESELATADMTQGKRNKNIKESGDGSSMPCICRAWPLNRKVVEAPRFFPPGKRILPGFHEFRLKSSERAMKNGAVSFYSHKCYRRKEDSEICFQCADVLKTETRSSVYNNYLRPGGSDRSYSLKTHPPNARALSFHSEKEVQPGLPVELFGKLSINAEV